MAGHQAGLGRGEEPVLGAGGREGHPSSLHLSHDLHHPLEGGVAGEDPGPGLEEPKHLLLHSTGTLQAGQVSHELSGTNQDKERSPGNYN